MSAYPPVVCSLSWSSWAVNIDSNFQIKHFVASVFESALTINPHKITIIQVLSHEENISFSHFEMVPAFILFHRMISCIEISTYLNVPHDMPPSKAHLVPV